jgi:hypothetical protein
VVIRYPFDGRTKANPKAKIQALDEVRFRNTVDAEIQKAE